MKKILKTTTLFVAAMAVMLSMQNCSSVKPIEKSKLEGYWTLKTLEGEDAKEAFKGPNPGMQFNFTDNMISGNGGCNNFSGGFTLTEANEFSAPNLVATLKACFQENKEPQFLKALSTPNLALSLDKDGNLIFKQNDAVMLEFTKGETPVENKSGAAATVETLSGKWNLTSIAGGDINTLFSEKKPTIEFAADNKIFGHAGCNTYRTSYDLKDGVLTFKPVASTMMACPSMQGENMYTGLLTTPLQATVDGDKLTLSKDGVTVLEFAKDTTSK